MLGHLSLGVRDLIGAGRFYDAALGALGFERVWSFEDAIGYGAPGAGDKLALFSKPDSPAPLAAGPGFHLAFDAPSAAAVDRFHSQALAHGGRCDGPPGPRPQYGPTYYAAFVVCPDGHKLEAVYQ